MDSASGPAALDTCQIALDANRHGLVIVAGAGLSMGHPSSLPGWNTINNSFIECLAMRIAEHTNGEVDSIQVAEFIAMQRDEAGTAAPDLQAQFAEESLGEAYFRLFEPLDITTWNDGHAAIAAIARSGVLRAVVTTNFDRLIEVACDAVGAETTTFSSADDFAQLAQRPANTVPIIKVHGSVDRRESIVDTLRQRVLGRPRTLEDALGNLFAEHAVMVVGFSGADLAYDPHYLGLRAGAQASPSFTFVTRAGTEPRPEIIELAKAAPNMCIVEGSLPDDLVALANNLDPACRIASPGWDGEMDFPGLRSATLPSSVYLALESKIDPVQATVVLAAIADAAGSGDAALRLLTSTMPHHSRAGFLNDPAMPRQQRMIAEHLIGLGFLHPELTKELDKEGALTALQVLGIPEIRPDSEGLALEALALWLVGDAVQADVVGLQALRESREEFRPARRADIVRVLAHLWSLAERWEQPLREATRQAYEMMWNYGDEPRRLRVGAIYGRFLIEAGELDEATRIVVDCQAASRRLRIASVHNDLVALGGRLHLARGDFEAAARTLQSVFGHYERSVETLRSAETLLPLREAAAASGNAELLSRSAPALNNALRMFPGLRLTGAASTTRMLCRAGAFAQAHEAVASLRELAESWPTNVWIEPLAVRLEHEIDQFDVG